MNNGGSYNYLPNITCNNYKTVTLKEKIVEDNLTTSESGLYYEDGEYIFKGKTPNNYLKFDGSIWLIIKIDANGNLKLVSVDQSKQTASWDNKFNEETNKTSGENDYATSNIRDILDKTYSKYKSGNKKHLIPFSACIGKRASDSIDKTSLVDCSTKLDNQYLGLLSPSDYALASYDSDCTDVISGSCINFNYLYLKLSETWMMNAIADNSYEVILYSPGRIKKAEAREGHFYNTVIYLSGSEKYTDGDGTEDDPYIIK